MTLTVLVGFLEPVVWEALKAAVSSTRTVEILRTDARGEALLSEAAQIEAAAVITSREEAEALGVERLPIPLLIGLSTEYVDALVWDRGERSSHTNPSAEAILKLVLP